MQVVNKFESDKVCDSCLDVWSGSHFCTSIERRAKIARLMDENAILKAENERLHTGFIKATNAAAEERFENNRLKAEIAEYKKGRDHLHDTREQAINELDSLREKAREVTDEMVGKVWALYCEEMALDDFSPNGMRRILRAVFE